MSAHTHPGHERVEQHAYVLAAMPTAQAERNAVRVAACTVRYLEPLLIPVAAGVWLYVLLLLAVGL